MYIARDKKQRASARPNTPDFTTNTIKRPGSIIKDNIKNVLSQKYGELDTKHIFDDIEDKDIENNLSTAEVTIRTNIDKGFLSKDVYSKYPNLRDGLALSYAAAEQGNKKAATRAREAAYTESDLNLPRTNTSKVTNLLYTSDMEQKPVNLLLKNTGNNNFVPVKYSNKKDDQKQKEDKKDNSFWDVASTALAAASFIPGADTVTNLLSIPVDLIKGDYVSAGLDALGMIPVVGELADAAKVARKADDIADAVKVAKKADNLTDAAKVAKKANNANDVVKAADTAIDGSKMIDGFNDGTSIMRASGKSTALNSVNDLPLEIQKNTKSFFKGSSNNYDNYSVIKNNDNTYAVKMENPGKVPGSKAVYVKIVDDKGNTIKVYKDTYDPQGNLIHRKDK